MGCVAAIDGRALRGLLQRRAFLGGIRSGKTPAELCKLLKSSPAAYHQARYRHPDWAAQIDDALWEAFERRFEGDDRVWT